MAGENNQNPNPNDQGGNEGILGGEGTPGEPNQNSNQKPVDPGAAPDEYASLKLPQGAEVDEKFFTDVKGWAKESGIKPEALQKLVEKWGARYTEAAKEQTQRAKDDRDKQVKGWVSELQSDKVFGGQQYKENVAGVRTFLSKVDPDKSFRKAIVEAGVDNWPPLVRFLHTLSMANKDDSVLGTLENVPKTALNDEKTFHSILYPTMVNKG